MVRKLAGTKENPLLGRWRYKSVGVLGLGREGIEVVRFMSQLGAQVTVLDGSSAKQLPNYDLARKLGADFRLGKGYDQELTDFDVIIRSPGVPLDKPELRRAIRKGVEVSSSTKIFFDLCPAKIIGITGTKGKSTTTSLIAHLLSERGRKVWVGGNIGASPLPALSKMRPDDWVVMELSSFQLEDMQKSPHIAVFLETVPEHLDRHKTFAKYLLAKQNIYRHQKKVDWLVTSIDFASSRKAIRETKSKVFEYSVKHVLRRGLYRDRDEIVYRDIRSGVRKVIGNVFDGQLVGKHNLYNRLPAIGVALLVGIDAKKIITRANNFKPLPHRLQQVRRIGDVVFVDDSLATTPEAAESAILAFPSDAKAMILGGVHKGGDLEKLAETIGLGGVEYVALIGASAKKLKAILKKKAPKVETEIHLTFKGAIKSSYKALKQGGVVLLSPACASFDMFKDAYDRGEKFGQIVDKL